MELRPQAGTVPPRGAQLHFQRSTVRHSAGAKRQIIPGLGLQQLTRLTVWFPGWCAIRFEGSGPVLVSCRRSASEGYAVRTITVSLSSFLSIRGGAGSLRKTLSFWSCLSVQCLLSNYSTTVHSSDPGRDLFCIPMYVLYRTGKSPSERKQ